MNIKTIIFSAVVVDVLFLFASRTFQPSGGGFTTGLWVVPVYFICIPILFGILGSVLSKEGRLKKGLVYSGISFLVAVIVMIPFAIWQGQQNKLETIQETAEINIIEEVNSDSLKQK